ncbi:hypothetical protein NHQ30_002105 [Ciborinia camelliae]|nr:hypothetical protein NHQ30_002105 [Ciborinia camelliae]
MNFITNLNGTASDQVLNAMELDEIQASAGFKFIEGSPKELMRACYDEGIKKYKEITTFEEADAVKKHRQDKLRVSIRTICEDLPRMERIVLGNLFEEREQDRESILNKLTENPLLKLACLSQVLGLMNYLKYWGYIDNKAEEEKYEAKASKLATKVFFVYAKKQVRIEMAGEMAGEIKTSRDWERILSEDSELRARSIERYSKFLSDVDEAKILPGGKDYFEKLAKLVEEDAQDEEN